MLRFFHKIIGTYKAPIWFHIKIFINNGVAYSCFIENEMIYSSDINKELMSHISKKLKLHLKHEYINWIDYYSVDDICKFLLNFDLIVYEDMCSETLMIITISGKLSERDIRKSLRNINNK
jgi:hypothetical protein